MRLIVVLCCAVACLHLQSPTVMIIHENSAEKFLVYRLYPEQSLILQYLACLLFSAPLFVNIL